MTEEAGNAVRKPSPVEVKRGRRTQEELRTKRITPPVRTKRNANGAANFRANRSPNATPTGRGATTTRDVEVGEE